MIEILGAGWVRFVFEESVDMPVYLVGDFNGWEECSHRMEPQDDGSYQAILKLDRGEFEFKYKCGGNWYNDPGAHKYVSNCWGSENSVVVVPPYEETESDPLRSGEAAVPPTA
jgi:1,4-alpha-glucan branching enzyme